VDEEEKGRGQKGYLFIRLGEQGNTQARLAAVVSQWGRAGPLLARGALCRGYVVGGGVIGEALRPCVSTRVEQPSPDAQTRGPSAIGRWTSIVPRISAAF
jgi:hypothetical protein